MKKYAILMLMFIAIILLGFVIGLYMFRAENVENEVTTIQNTVNNRTKENTEAIRATNSGEEKVSVNTKIVQKVYYTDCEHLISTQLIDKQKYINKTKSEMQLEFINWTIQKFTINEVVLYKEVYDFCNEHYMACDEFGYIVIYKLDKYNAKEQQIMATGIAVEFLSEEDRKELNTGIKLCGKEELNEFLQDFE